MRLLWIGINFNEEIKNELVSYGTAILSGAFSEENLVNGIDTIGYTDMDTINSYRYPKCPKGPKIVERKEWSRNGVSCDVSVPYKNAGYFSHFYREKSLKKEVREWAKGIDRDEKVIVFVYSMHSPFMAAAKELKKIHKNTTIAILVLDLPQFMDLHMSRVKKVLKALDWKKIKKYMKSVDKYILYSKHMAEFLHLKDGSWTVMEGSFDPALVVEETVEKGNKLPIMYSGVLDTRYGIPELLEAFSQLDDRFELWFTGSGNAVDLINECAEKDSRIHNFGFLPSRHDLLLKQKQAAMLISTRRPDEAASDYCFPSKLFEYMISGNPVLSCRIGGIPDEYFNYLVEMKSTSPEDIKEAILKVAEMPQNEREERGEKSREFILKEKSNISQARKIIEFVMN